VDNVDFESLWTNLPDIAAIFVASVAAEELGQRLARGLTQRFRRAPQFVASTAQACGVRNAYPHPQRLGVDRLLGTIALHAGAKRPFVLASCGTALTLDALSADGTHLGGLICASPGLMLDALVGNTGRLTTPQGARVVELADDTGDAMHSGAWLAATA